jgi:transcriptional regulator with XRE-family HTH domain
MRKTYEKLRDAREKLGFSQEYVARCLGISRSAVTQIELGNRKVSSDELAAFCRLYHLSADYLTGVEQLPSNQLVFARSFSELSNEDQQEIINLIAFKREMATRQERR